MPLPQIERSEGTSRIRRLGVLAVVASFVGIWGYVMYLSIFVGRADDPDLMDDRAWVAAAEETCAPFQATIGELPLAATVDSPAQRADLLDDATDIVEDMVAALRTLPAPATAEEAEVIVRWLADYDEYIRNRRVYADDQRDPTSERYDRPISYTELGPRARVSDAVTDFAHINRMESCEPPLDV